MHSVFQWQALIFTVSLLLIDRGERYLALCSCWNLSLCLALLSENACKLFSYVISSVRAQFVSDILVASHKYMARGSCEIAFSLHLVK
jgi:hypothetical protein